MKNAIMSIWLILILAGCATFPTNYRQIPSTAFQHPEITELGRFFASSIEQHPGKSGFWLLNKGKEAILARTALADMAERTIDIQYYIWENDASGWLLLGRVVRAAQRGVRVRILVDDITLGGRDFKVAAALNARYPTIEFRLYNPFSRRYRARLLRRFEFIGNVSRLNHRMHNKIFAVDNQVAIVGGRNIGDSYFGTDPELNYRDLDWLMTGPVAAGVSASFDAYWNSRWAVPLEAFKETKPSQKDIDHAKQLLRENTVKFEKEYPYRLDVSRQDILKRLREIRDTLIWADAEVLYDPPDKGRTTEQQQQGVNERLATLAQEAQHHLLIETPFFIPTEFMLKRMGEIAGRGVTLRILTNSLASTDVTIAQAAYGKYRESLLDSGVRLYELRPDAKSRNLYIADPSLPSKLGLHAKVVVFDQEKVFIGTFNLDPRSLYLNTEVGVLVHSAELARAVTEALEIDFQAQNSWQVILEHDVSSDEFEDRELVWVTKENERETRYYLEPASFCRILAAALLSLLPVEEHL